MLKRVTFSGFKIFKNKTVIDFSSSRSEILKDTNVKDGILRGGLFFGSNGSGKTSALNAISVLLDLLFKDFKFPVESICVFSKKKIASFTYDFVFDNNDVSYTFSVDRNGDINYEELIYNKEKIFTRISNNVNTIVSDNNVQEASPNILFLRTVYFNTNFVGYPILEKMMSYLKNSIYIDRMNNKMITFSNSNFLDTNLVSYIDKYGVEDMNNFLNKYEIPYILSHKKQEVLGNKYISIDVKNLRTNYSVPFQYESYGNKLIIQLIPYFLTCQKNGGMILMDEFGGGCHNKLNELVVEFLFKKCDNVQSILVTHETNLLKTSIVRPDQIFIFDYNEDGAFISKASNSSPRESQNLEKMYLSGVFGGIPSYKK